MVNIQFQPVSQLVVVFVSAGCWEPGKRAIFTNSHIGCEKGHKRVALGWAAALRTTVWGWVLTFRFYKIHHQQPRPAGGLRWEEGFTQKGRFEWLWSKIFRLWFLRAWIVPSCSKALRQRAGLKARIRVQKNGMCNQTVALFVVYSDSVSNQ